jgi:hypothetical protein
MNARTEAPRGDDDAVTAMTYSLTFGVYNQSGPWIDVRALIWPELAALLTRHDIGPKEGSCLVPAVFADTRRTKDDALRIAVALLDSDAGATLEEIRDAIARRGWTAIISSTHSHLSTRTKANRGHWERFRAATAEDPDRAAEAFLRREKGYHPRVAAGARLVEETDEQVVFAHQPCPKFRIAIPLLRPWVAADYPDQPTANAAWKARVEALAAALGLAHDQACTDTSRLFFLPRRPPGGPQPETALLEGEPCDVFALPAPSDGNGDKSRRRGQPPERHEYTDPATGEVLDLTAWARRYGQLFQIVAALRARSPEVFVGKVTDGVKHHIRCPNEDAHTQAGADAATFVVDASASANRGGFVCHCRHAHCAGLDRLAFLRRMLERGWLAVADLTDPRFLGHEDSGKGLPRPVIPFVAGDLPAVVDQAERALIAADLDLYQRGPFVVRPGHVLVTVARRQEVLTQRVLEVGEHALVEAMTRAAEWQKFDGRAGRWVPIDAPAKVAATYLERVGQWRLPVLAGIINAPTLRPDGTILATPGYDPHTGLLLDPGGVHFPEIPETPDWEDAREALSVLLCLVETFPFVAEADRAVALSAILTACVRRSLPTAPLHGFTAPTAGSGKSMLVDLAGVIATGREVGVIAQGKSEEEFEKRLGALLLAGDQVVAIDNCEAPLGGEFLCQMLTQPVVRARILGRSEAPELPSNAFVAATGNNLALLGDLTRRAVLCRLDPKVERPELRTFGSHPVQTVKADRGRYLCAALTVLRAFHVAGRPRQCDPLGSFEAWSDCVRGALLWLGQADPVATMEEARAADPKLESLAAASQWHAVIGRERVTARDIIDRATAQQTPLGYARTEYRHPDFREALLVVAGDGGVVNSRRLGKWLSANKNRVVQGVRIVPDDARCGAGTWRLDGKFREAAGAAD